MIRAGFFFAQFSRAGGSALRRERDLVAQAASRRFCAAKRQCKPSAVHCEIARTLHVGLQSVHVAGGNQRAVSAWQHPRYRHRKEQAETPAVQKV
jgi:hypothetical protein